jgi:hypothetical protein
MGCRLRRRQLSNSWTTAKACLMRGRCFTLRHGHHTGDGVCESGHRLRVCIFRPRGKTYKITLPAPIPVGQFWSFMAYDGQTRSMLETDQRLAGLDCNRQNIKKNADGSVTVWFAPKARAGEEANWVQTMPGKGWNSLLRLYAPLEPWFNKTWKPGDFELVN